MTARDWLSIYLSVLQMMCLELTVHLSGQYVWSREVLVFMGHYTHFLCFLLSFVSSCTQQAIFQFFPVLISYELNLRSNFVLTPLNGTSSLFYRHGFYYSPLLHFVLRCGASRCHRNIHLICRTLEQTVDLQIIFQFLWFYFLGWD